MTNQRVKKKAREAVIKPPHEPFLIIAKVNVQFKFLKMCHYDLLKFFDLEAVFSFLRRSVSPADDFLERQLLSTYGANKPSFL